MKHHYVRCLKCDTKYDRLHFPLCPSCGNYSHIFPADWKTRKFKKLPNIRLKLFCSDRVLICGECEKPTSYYLGDKPFTEKMRLLNKVVFDKELTYGLCPECYRKQKILEGAEG